MESRLYTYTSGIFLWLSCLTMMTLMLPRSVLADVIAVTRKNVSYTFPSMPSNFGDRLPLSGFEGKLVVAVPLNGCHPLQQPPRSNASEMMSYNYFALIRRDDCNFDLKVWNAQKVGYSGAVVYNTDSDDSVLAMNGDEYGRDVYIPSVFVGASSGAALKNLNYTSGSKIIMNAEFQISYNIYLIPFISIVGICFTLMLCFMGQSDFNPHSQLSRELFPLSICNCYLNLPGLLWYLYGDDYDVCAICLDDYEEGDKLRILPCNHAFHCKCVDPWLTNNRRTCPVCKRKVVPSGEPDSDSDSDDVSSESPTEHTPLLAGGSNNHGIATENTAALSVEVDGAWGGEERLPVTLVDASTAMTENDTDDENDDSNVSLLSRSPNNPSSITSVTSPILATPTLHAVPQDFSKPAEVSSVTMEENVPAVVVKKTQNQVDGNHEV